MGVARGLGRGAPRRTRSQQQEEWKQDIKMAPGAWALLLPLAAIVSASPQSNYDLQALSTEYRGGPQTFPEFATLNRTQPNPSHPQLQCWIHVCSAAVQAGVLWNRV